MIEPMPLQDTAAAESEQLKAKEETLHGVLLAHEKEMIEAALAQNQGRMSGPAGAASQAGHPRFDPRSKNQTHGNRQVSI